MEKPEGNIVGNFRYRGVDGRVTLKCTLKNSDMGPAHDSSCSGLGEAGVLRTGNDTFSTKFGNFLTR